MENTAVILSFSAIMINIAHGYVQCGANVCHGPTAQCCSWDKDECCWLSWYTVWWTWVGAIIFMAVLFSLIICCFQKRRRHASTRHIIVVRQPSRYVYGSMSSYPANDSYKSTMEVPYSQYQQTEPQHYEKKVNLNDA